MRLRGIKSEFYDSLSSGEKLVIWKMAIFLIVVILLAAIAIL